MKEAIDRAGKRTPLLRRAGNSALTTTANLITPPVTSAPTSWRSRLPTAPTGSPTSLATENERGHGGSRSQHSESRSQQQIGQAKWNLHGNPSRLPTRGSRAVNEQRRVMPSSSGPHGIRDPVQSYEGKMVAPGRLQFT